MKKNIYLSVWAVIAAIMITACEPKGFEPENDGKVTSIAVKEAVYVSAGTPSMQISLKDNAELQLNVVILPQDAKNQKVTFSNRQPALMEITETGVIKPKTFGTDTLTVSSTDGSGVFTNFVVNITDHQVKATAINVTAAGSNFELKIGGNSFNLGACVTLSPADTWNKSVTYTSNDESVATVTTDGIVTPVSVGATTISIQTTDGSNLTKDCNVVVRDLVIRKVDLACTDWMVTTETATNYGHVTDGSTGLPQHLFDDVATTFLSLVKPGKSYGSVPAQPADFLPSFTVDMQSPKTFDFIRWQHRSGNSYNYLRVFGIHIAGSNDGSNFTPIQADMVWIPNKGGYVGTATTADTETYRIDISSATYRYVKVTLSMWSDIYNSQHPDYPGLGALSGSTMQISEFGLGYTVVE